ncbi:MAG: hypothetical protein OEV76_10190, partial [Anaerolineae bacterium]|nr:hypothetical protein [Anaerolineae bacterium]
MKTCSKRNKSDTLEARPATTPGDNPGHTEMRCPYCEAEVESGDVHCGECGQPLSAASQGPGRRWRPLAVAAIAILFVLCLAGAATVALLMSRPPAVVPASSPVATETVVSLPSSSASPLSTPGDAWANYQSEQLGVSLRYPQNWLLNEQADVNQVVFAPAAEDLQVAEFLTGTSFAVTVNTTAAFGTESPDVVLDNLAEFLAGTYEQLQFGEVLSAPIDGQEGALMYVEGEFSRPGVPLKGWVAAVVADEHVYVFSAAAPVEDWPAYETTLRAMLESVRLSPPRLAAAEPTSTPQPTVALPTPTVVAPGAPPTALASPPMEGPDLYEPDDSIAQAVPISTDGTPQERSLHTAGDLDYASFDAEQGRAYTIETFGLGPEIDTIIYLYDGQGQELAHNDDGTEELLASRIIWIAPESGTYYVMVHDLAGDSAGWEATYSLVVEESASLPGADPFEPDDDFAAATPLETTGTPQTHTF